MEQLRKYITPFILVIALFAINGAEFLHHHDASEGKMQEDKCQACIFSHSLNTTLVEQVYVFTPQLLTFQSVSSFTDPVVLAEFFSNAKDRAPPAFHI
jgi:hypothetical protein